MRKRSNSKMAAGNWMVPVSSTAFNVAPAVPVAPTVPAVPAAPAAPVTSGVPVGPTVPVGPMQQTGGLDPISATILQMNTNPYLIGMFMLLLNLGGRFLSLELTKKQEAFLQSSWLRPLLFFTVIFIATRNLVAAFWITLLFFFVIWVVANENSPFCMVPSWCGSESEPELHTTYEQNVAHMSIPGLSV